MNCIEHPEVDSVIACGRCGAGLCQMCANSTLYQVENKPLCKKCNYEVGYENNQFLKSFLKSKWIKMIIFCITFAIGLISFFINKANGSSTASAVIIMLFFWGLGFIGNFFEKKKDTRSVKTQTKEAIYEAQHPITTFVGKILGFFSAAVSSPIQIVLLLIGINKVKKQIDDNDSALEKLGLKQAG